MTDLPPQPSPNPSLSRHAYHQLAHTLCGVLPPPLADTPQALLTRNHAAIAKAAAMQPANDDEADIAAHCVAARAQAEDALRLLQRHAGDVHLLIKLRNQYALMERTAIGLRNQLHRLQTARHKREKDGAAAESDAWMGYIASRSMQQALAQDVAAGPGPELMVCDEPPEAPDAPSQPQPEASEQSPVPAAAAPPMPAAPPPEHAASAPPSRHRDAPTATQTEDQPRDLAAEVDYYAAVYPHRAVLIRRHGGLPPNCDFGPPDDDLVHAIVSGTSAALRALDTPAAA